MPYKLENLQHITTKHAQYRIFEKWKAYEVLRTIDTDSLEKHNRVRSKVSDGELRMRAQHHIDSMLKDTRDDALMREYENRHHWVYGLVLKMAIIQLKDPRLPLKQKVHRFLEYCDSQLAIMFASECVVARNYFESGHKLGLFSKVHKNQRNLFTILDGMAWDLSHVRYLEQALTFKMAHARYFFSAILTFDEAIVEVIDMYPVKACACALIDGSHVPISFPAGDWFALVTDEPAEQDRLCDRFYSNQACTSRAERWKEAKSRLAEIISSLEAELSNVANVPRPCT